MKSSVERLFPFAQRARILVVGRHNLVRLRKHLLFVLITEDISANSKREIEKEFGDLPILQCYLSAELETHFSFHNTKVLGFRKSPLSNSIYHELKHFRLPAGGGDELPADEDRGE